ncbi:glycerophosphoryl diester phosphodiesterase [Isoptericola sp. CG 20/1183]|uniref:glycerophosphodiester phosphodiesterase n=1 Tax=Isoptericola halotolerans TaxID=300560 RepID=A0ABX5EGY8_9MICO|nr:MULTISPECIES: esterase-like activity of phytase family protein [Isoptericola]PRZ07691.1 glycerophosphoryl diester phosphodiesterase [Isoptericola halotolerans]PRZ07950.1 glycerophosphoryl diester phosphodiesterase [Isoptericola sp. CG 20/1183]
MRRTARSAPFVRTVAAGTAATVLLTALTTTAATATTADRPGPGRHHHHEVPVLEGRATLSADFLADGPPSGADASPANGRQGPWDGQVIPGFSAMVDNGDGTFWAQPDNGFGTQGNSADFLLRSYLVEPDWDTGARHSGSGDIEILDRIDYNDANGVLDFPIVRSGTTERLLTGADFDIESVVRAQDGSFWVGEEFGPFVLHFDASGTLLEEPIPLPGGLKSPQNPYLADGEAPGVRASSGFEAMSASPNGRYLYPVIENALVGTDDERRRVVYELDTRSGEYTGRTWDYQTDLPGNVIGDSFTVGKGRFWFVERDNFDAAASVTKRVYEVDLRRTDHEGFVAKKLVLDALKIDNPRGIDAGEGYGLGETFALPVQSFETVLRLRDGRILIGNDNNYPGNDARVPGTPDDTEMVVVDLERQRTRDDGVTVVGHRGASGYRPEHTLAAYEQAILQCADYIEPDVVATKDGVLVARHENEIGGTTDVADHPEFADRRTTKTIDGREVTGWFTEDFTLAELRTLRAQERLGELRPGSAAFDGLYQVPTLDEVLDLARRSETCDGRQVGVYPETKHPTYFDSVGLSLEEPLVAELEANGLDSRRDPVILQSFETGNLRDLDEMTDVRIAQLVSASGAPYDLVAAGESTTYADLVTRRGLRQVAGYADGIGAAKDVLIPREADGTLGEPTSVIRDAHRAGLEVHAWTFRAENTFLPTGFRSSGDPAEHGDLAGEIRVFLDAGLDGLFADHPDLAVAALGGHGHS